MPKPNALTNILLRFWDSRYALCLIALSRLALPMFWAGFAACLIIFQVVPRRRSVVLFVFSFYALWAFFASDSVVRLGIGPASLVLATLAFFALYHLSLFLILRYFRTWPLCSFLSLYGLLMAALFQSEGIWTQLLSAFLIMLSCETWTLIRNLDSTRPTAFSDYLGLRVPTWFWCTLLPASVEELRREAQESPAGILRCQRGGALYLAILLCLRAAKHVALGGTAGAFGTAVLASLAQRRNLAADFHRAEALVAGAPSPLRNWMLVVITGASFLVEMAFSWGLLVVTANAFGFSAAPNNANPLRARSYQQFLSRSFRYYSMILMRVFYPRMAWVARALPPRRRIYLAIFLSILVGGPVFHAIRDSFLLRGGSVAWVERQASFSLYFLLMAFAVVASAYREIRFPREGSGLASRWGIPLLSFTIYSLIVTVDVLLVHMRVPWPTFLEFIRFLAPG